MATGLFLTDAERTRLQSFPKTVSREDTAAYFTLSRRDLAVTRRTRGSVNRLGFAVALGSLRYLGYLPGDLAEAPLRVREFVARQLAVAPDLVPYGHRAPTRRTHARLVAKHLKFRRARASDLADLQRWVTEQAADHARPTALLSWASERLHRLRIIRPGVTTLERIVVRSRRDAESQNLDDLLPVIEPNKTLLETLVEPALDHGPGSISWLRQREKTNSPRAIKVMLDKHRWLCAAGVADWELHLIPPNRLRYLARLGDTANPQMLRRMPPRKRFPALVAFLRQALVNITDELVDMFDRCLADTLARARHDLQEYRGKADRTRDDVIDAFDVLASVLLDDHIADMDVRAHVFARISASEIAGLLESCRGTARALDPEGLDFLGSRYGYLRQFSPRFLAQMDVHCDEARGALLKGVQALRAANLEGQLPDNSPVGFVPRRWRRFVITDGVVDRRYYELCVLYVLRDALKSGTAWITNSWRFTPVSTYVISTNEWAKVRSSAIEDLGAEGSAGKALDAKAKSLEDLEDEASGAVQAGDLRLEDGRLVLPPLVAGDRPDTLVELEYAVSAQLPRVELCDLLTEVDAWVRFSKHLLHISEQKAPQGRSHRHVLAAILARSSNLGFTRMADVADMTFEQLAWVGNWYLTDASLKGAFSSIVDFHHRLPLSASWGGGSLSSSDGQRFPVAGRVPSARALPRYFGYGRGLTFYTWTSDQYSQYGAKVIPATSRDATYVLDEILDNETELELIEHTTDTAGYTDIIFGLFDLLGMRFAPRIRDTTGTRVFRIEGAEARWADLKPARTIRRALIEEHWDEMLRLAASLRTGYVTASLLVSKLQGHSDTGVARALVEYGRLCKTEHVLRYLAAEGYRRRIGRQLNKGEALHGLRRFLVFGNLARLKSKDVDSLVNQAACLNLVTNAVVLWNTVYMQRVLDRRRKNGLPVLDEDVARLSPARYEHINPYGKYRFDRLPAAGRFRRLRP